MNYADVRGALRQARSKAGLTLDQVAEITGLNRATIHSVENLKREPDLQPLIDTMERLAVAYGGRLSVVYRDASDPLPVSSTLDETTGAPKSQVVIGDPEAPPSDQEREIWRSFARLVARENERIDSATHRPGPSHRAEKPKTVTHDRRHARPVRKRTQRRQR